jgi:hypothetical protein
VTVTVNNPIPPPPADHLAAAYAFDESAAATTADSSGNGNTGLLHDASFVAGRHGNALAFDGAGESCGGAEQRVARPRGRGAHDRLLGPHRIDVERRGLRDLRQALERLVHAEPTRPAQLALSTLGPNPFHGRTGITFALPSRLAAELRTFDASGRVVRTLARGTFEAGAHPAQWDGRDAAGHAAPAGRYFLRLRAGGLERTIDLVLFR